MFVRVTSRSLSALANFQRAYHKVGVIGVPFNKGQKKQGVEMSPGVLRQSGFINDLVTLDPKVDVKDFGDITYKLSPTTCDISNMKNWYDVSACAEQLSKRVQTVIKDNRICLTLGGDHCIAIGSIDGHARACGPANIAVLYIDAHADINTNKSSTTGNIHGMPLSLLVTELKDEWNPLPMRDWQTPHLSLQQLAFIGLRDVDPYEMDVIKKFGVAAFEMKDVKQYGITKVIQMALERVDPESKRSIHVSFDIDSLDVTVAPSTGTPVPGGLTLNEGMEIVKTVRDTGRLKALDLVEVYPSIGTSKDVENTVNAAKQIILSAFVDSHNK